MQKIDETKAMQQMNGLRNTLVTLLKQEETAADKFAVWSDEWEYHRHKVDMMESLIHELDDTLLDLAQMRCDNE